jgi:hypothetical protein
MTFCTTTPNGAVSTFGPILVKNMGFTSNLINLALQVPTGFVGLTVVLVSTYIARKKEGVRLYLVMFFALIILGGSLVLWLAPRSATAGLMIGYCIPSLTRSVDGRYVADYWGWTMSCLWNGSE